MQLRNSGAYLVHMQALIPPHIAAERLGVSRNTILNMARDGRLTPVAKVEGPLGAYLFDEEQIDRLAAEAAR